MVTINEIAKRAGVAKSTVSNVLSGRKFVSPEITERVLRICDEMNYKPSFFATLLSTKTRTNIIGLFLEESSGIKYQKFYSILIESIINEASKYNINLLIYNGLNDGETSEKLRLGQSPIDGAIILSPKIDDMRITQFRDTFIPFVLIGHPESNSNINFVDVDNTSLTNTIAKQMIRKGSKYICLLNSVEKLVISKERDLGFIQALEGTDVKYLIKYGESTYEESYNYALEALEDGCDSFITASGVVARGVYDACEKMNKKIGEDIFVFSLGYSFDEGLNFDPKLSYATQNYYVIGQRATNILIGLIKGDASVSKEMIESQLNYNESFKY